MTAAVLRLSNVRMTSHVHSSASFSSSSNKTDLRPSPQLVSPLPKNCCLALLSSLSPSPHTWCWSEPKGDIPMFSKLTWEQQMFKVKVQVLHTESVHGCWGWATSTQSAWLGNSLKKQGWRKENIHWEQPAYNSLSIAFAWDCLATFRRRQSP